MSFESIPLRCIINTQQITWRNRYVLKSAASWMPENFCSSRTTYFPPNRQVIRQGVNAAYLPTSTIGLKTSFLFLKIGLPRPFFVFSNKHYNFCNKCMWKMAISYIELGFEPTTFWIWILRSNPPVNYHTFVNWITQSVTPDLPNWTQTDIT